jgi:hypothetical protein
MAILELNDEKVNVFPCFSENYAALQDVPIASVSTMWENPRTGKLWMLVFHDALYFGQQLNKPLLCPNQMHAGSQCNNRRFANSVRRIILTLYQGEGYA